MCVSSQVSPCGRTQPWWIRNFGSSSLIRAVFAQWVIIKVSRETKPAFFFSVCQESVGKLCYTYHQQQSPVGFNDCYDAKDRQSKECKANEDANPGSSIDVIIFCGFQQRVETMGIGHKVDALCCQGNTTHLRSTSLGNPLNQASPKK